MDYKGSDEIFPHLTWACTACGALVYDMRVHDAWHDRGAGELSKRVDA